MKIAIFIQNNKVLCYSCDIDSHWSHRSIKGEYCAELEHDKSKALALILREFSDRLNLEQALGNVKVHLLYGQADVGTLADIPKVLAELRCCTWQILRLEPMLARAALVYGVLPQALESNDQWLNDVLPILDSTFSYSSKAFAAEKARVKHAHKDTMDSLGADELAKQLEVTQLQARINALQLPNIEHLLVYLPAIYQNFWGVVTPDDLALLAGTLTVPRIQSPYPEPSPETVIMLKRRFLKLPVLERERVLDFCLELQHRLEVRVGMRDLFGER
jgi:hypothetical protein